MVSILSTNDWRLKLVGWAGLSPSKRFPFMRTPEKATQKHHLTIGWSFGEREYSHQAETWWSKWGVGIPQYKTLVEGCNGRVNVDAWTLWGWCNSNLFFGSLSLTCCLWKENPAPVEVVCQCLSTIYSCNLLLRITSEVLKDSLHKQYEQSWICTIPPHVKQGRAVSIFRH